MKFVIVLVLLFAVTAYAQEAALPHPFTGKWSTDFGVLNLCTVGNKVYGGFETGYLDAVLGPDRRTLIGTFVYAGNTPDSAPRGARLSVDANNTLIYGFVQSGDSSYSVSYDNIPSDTEPTNFDCRVPSSVKGASIVGAWKTLSDSGEETVINVCYTGDGFTFEATDTNGYYYRGQILAGGLTGAATLYSYQDPTEAFAYGGALFRVIDNGEAHPSLVLTAYSSDIGLVQQNGCNSSPLLSCDQAVFTYSDVESPGVCGSQSSLAAWNGYWTFTATNSELVTRVQGNRVFGNYFFGVFEGVIDPNDPLLVSGIYFSASFQNQGSQNENYFGTFRIQMSPDGKYFSGTIWANFGQINGCNSGGCERDWQETRLPGFATDPSAREVNGISPLLSTNMTTAGVYEFDGHYLDGVNKAYYYRCNIPGQGGDSVEAKGDLTYGSYTENGCGRSTGAERGQVQFSGRSVEPAGTTASENWYDETGYGTQLVRRISDSTMRVNWFFDNPDSVFPDLSFCPPELPGSCAGIDSYIFSSTPAQPSDCRFCFAQNPASPASTLTISFFFMAFLALFVAFH